MNSTVLKIYMTWDNDRINFKISGDKIKLISGSCEIETQMTLDIMESTECILDISGLESESLLFNNYSIWLNNVNEDVLQHMILNNVFIQISDKEYEKCTIQVKNKHHNICYIGKDIPGKECVYRANNDTKIIGRKRINKEIKKAIKEYLNNIKIDQ